MSSMHVDYNCFEAGTGQVKFQAYIYMIGTIPGTIVQLYIMTIHVGSPDGSDYKLLAQIYCLVTSGSIFFTDYASDILPLFKSAW